MDFIGIYIIISKSHPERYYIGSSINIEERWNTHKSDFKVGRRHSPHFQRHFEKYGINDFEFLILECTNYISKDDLLSREQHWINTLNPYFNGCKIAGSPLGYKHTEESKRKLSNTFKRLGLKPPSTKGKKWGPNTSKKHSENNKRLGLVPPSRKGKKHSKETIEKMKMTKLLNKQLRINAKCTE